MKMKKFLAIILTVIMAASMLCAGAMAADPTFRGADIEAKAGETITYDVYIENNPGIAGYMVLVDFSEDAFDLSTQDADEFENTFKISMGDFSLNNDTFGNLISNRTNYGCVALWFNIDEVDDDGVAFSVTLKVSDNAINGKHAVKIRYDAVNTIDGDYNLVSFKTVDGSVTVSGGVDGTIDNDAVGPTDEELQQMEEGTLSAQGNVIEKNNNSNSTSADDANGSNSVDKKDQLDVTGDAASDSAAQNQKKDSEGLNVLQLVLIIAAIVVAIVISVLIILKVKSKKMADGIENAIPADEDREMEIEEVFGWDDNSEDDDDDDDDED